MFKLMAYYLDELCNLSNNLRKWAPALSILTLGSTDDRPMPFLFTHIIQN